MNILFYLTPKCECAYLVDTDSIRQAMEKMEARRRRDYMPISINAKMEDLIDLAMKQNFVPVADDDGSFIGIVTRQEIMKYFYNLNVQAGKSADSHA